MINHPETIYLLGAGFTKALCQYAPLNKDLLSAITKDGGTKLAEYQNKIETDDIEQLLTEIDLKILKNNQLQKDRTIIEAEIANFFSKFRFSECGEKLTNWFKDFAQTILKQNDIIISLNYDCLLEGGLDNYGVWSPNEGYIGVLMHPTDSLPKNNKNIKIYKIHGSENFVKSSVIGKNPNQTSLGFKINESIYPRSGANSVLGGGAKDPRPSIIAPSFVKVPHVDIASMMLKLLDHSLTARNFIIIGCGMRLEDSFLWLLLTRFLNKVLDRRKRLIILSPSADAIWKKISDYWVGEISGFADVLIIPCRLDNGIKMVAKFV